MRAPAPPGPAGGGASGGGRAVSARRQGRQGRGRETWSCARNPNPELRPAPEAGRRARGRALGLAWLRAKVRRSAPVAGSHTSTAPFFPADASASPAAPRRPPFSRFTLQSRSQHRARSGCAAAALRRTQAPSAAAARGCGGRRRAPCGEKARAKMSVLLCNHRLTCTRAGPAGAGPPQHRPARLGVGAGGQVAPRRGLRGAGGEGRGPAGARLAGGRGCDGALLLSSARNVPGSEPHAGVGRRRGHAASGRGARGARGARLAVGSGEDAQDLRAEAAGRIRTLEGGWVWWGGGSLGWERHPVVAAGRQPLVLEPGAAHDLCAGGGGGG